MTRTLLGVAALVATSVSAAAVDLAPGRHRRVKCPGSSYTYDVRIPAAYATDRTATFPVLFFCSPNGGGNTYGMDRWAERSGVILVTINDSKNGQTLDIWSRAQDAVVEAVESTLRVHPCLRFSMGLSGGGMAAMHLANRMGEKHAGVCMLAHSGNGRDRGLETHIAVAFVHGEKDNVHPASAARSVERSLRSRGHQTRIHVGDWGHNSGSLEWRERFMDWMLEVARLTHPGLSDAEKRKALEQIRKRIESLDEIADPAERLSAAEALMELPGSDRWPETPRLRAAWFAARFEQAQAMADAVARHDALTDFSLDPRLKSCAPADRRRLSNTLRKMRMKSPVKEEWKARRLYEQVAAFEEKAGKSRLRLVQAARTFQSLAKRYRGTVYGRKAREAAERIAQALNAGK